jgi:purine-cytosine permease-like protein
MQVFNRGQKGGAYWFNGGWNIPGAIAWGLSAFVALSTVNLPDHWVGWLGRFAGDVDISLLAALVLPALLYPLCLLIFPEPKGVYGPLGPRFVRSSDTPIAPVVRQ